jgi:ribosome-associated protein
MEEISNFSYYSIFCLGEVESLHREKYRQCIMSQNCAIITKKRLKMKFELHDDYIELYKLIKHMGLADSGAHAKMLIEEGSVKRNEEVELRKRAKILAGESVKVGDVLIEVISVTN